MKKYSLAILSLIMLPAICHANPIDLGQHLGMHFTPPDSDQSMQYLADMFGVVGGVLHGDSSQIMGKMFGVLNAAALSLGGIIVMYILLSSTLNTSQDGELMGKRWSSIWIPIRTALGVGLLLPTSTGYSFIQVFVMWVVLQGVGAADSIWNAALNYLANGGVIITKSFNPSLVGQIKAKQSLGNLFQSQVCMYGLENKLQSIRSKAIRNGANNIPPAVPSLAATINPLSYAKPGAGSIPIPNLPKNSPYASYNGACGSMSWTEASPNSIQLNSRQKLKIVNARKSALQQLLLDYASGARQVVQNFSDGAQGLKTPLPVGYCPSSGVCNSSTWSDGNNSVLPGNLMHYGYTDYQAIMTPTIREITSGPASDTGWMDGAKAQGWIMAGSYYYKLAKFNEGFQSLADNSIPNVTLKYPNGNKFCSSGSPFSQLDNDNPSNCGQLQSWIFGKGPQNNRGVPTYINDGLEHYSLPNTHGVSNTATGTAPGADNAAMQHVFSLLGTNHLNQLQSAGENPLVKLVDLGNTLLNVVTAIWLLAGLFAALAAATGAIPSVTVSAGMLALVGWLAPFLAAVLILLFVAGVVLAFYVPMIPFIIFTFASLGWFIGVIEALVAAPIVALGVIHPEGHELWGKADQAIMLLTNVFLRPGLMVIGLIGGIGLSYVGLWLLNSGFGHGTDAVTGNVNGVAGMWQPVAMEIVYAVLVVAIVQKAFTLIHVLPDKVLRWLSGGLQESLGAEAAGEALGMSKGALSSTGQQVGGAMSSGIGGAMKPLMKEDKDTPSASAKGVGDKKNSGSVESDGGEASMKPSGSGSVDPSQVLGG